MFSRAPITAWSPAAYNAASTGSDAATHALSAGTTKLIVGALPFDPAAATALYEPAEATIASRPWQPRDPQALPTTRVDREIPSSSEHLRRVEKLIGRLRSGEIDKVVAARTVELRTQTPISPNRARRTHGGAQSRRQHLCRRPLCCGSRIRGPQPGRREPPEVLVSRRGRVVTCRPLAGTTKRSADADQDREAGESLLHSTKNLAEHAFVTSWIREVLQPMCSDLSVPATPELTNTHEVWHLASPIRGTLRNDTTALDLAIALHPTPALCGTPTDAALKVIRETEEPRRFYGGAVGWCDEAGDGDWVVAIRCRRDRCRRPQRLGQRGWWNRRRIGSAGRTRRDVHETAHSVDRAWCRNPRLTSTSRG